MSYDKVLFLDIDGVLIPIGPVGIRDNYPTPSAEAISNLNQITQFSGAKIVISSAWRVEHSLDSIISTMWGWGVRGQVIGSTPFTSTLEAEEDRGRDISKWLAANGPVTSFVILDDEPIDLEEFARNRVMPKPDVGLSFHDAADALRILRVESSN